MTRNFMEAQLEAQRKAERDNKLFQQKLEAQFNK